jgi:hypothetical protein
MQLPIKTRVRATSPTLSCAVRRLELVFICRRVKEGRVRVERKKRKRKEKTRQLVDMPLAMFGRW